jgi:Helix-turn-helix domain
MSTVLSMIDSPSLLGRITPEQKQDLFTKLDAVQMMLKAGYGHRGEAKKIAAKQLRVSEQAVQNWYDLFNKNGCEALVDGRRKRGDSKGISATTKAWIFEEYCRLQREDSGVEIFKFIRDRARMWWKTGNPRFAIPGFMDPPRITAKGYPEGLSQETIRRCGPDAYQRALAHQGRKTASGLLPSIPDTRVGVGYLERIFFDDQMYDHYIREAGYDKPMRPVGFNALDYLTGAFLDFHIRLRWWDEDSKSHKSLTQREYVWFVIGLLSTVGYRTDSRGTRLVFEHGTANSWSSETGKHVTQLGYTSFDDALFAATDQHVTIDRSGKFNKATWSEMLFVPKSAGNFRYKAPIESMFRAVRTHGLLLPGATGRKAELAPEETYGLEREERRWLKLANSFPSHIAESVKSNLFSFMEYYRAYRTIYAGINADPDHALKDWDKIGFCLREWQWNTDEPDQWRPRSELASLDENRRASFDIQLSENQQLIRTRRMSRAEAVRVCENDPAIRTLDKWKFHQLLPLSWALPITVRANREIVISDPLITGTGDITYFTTCRNERGHILHLQPGDNILCHLNPFRPDELIVLDQHGVPIGMTPRRPDNVPSNSEIAKELLGARALMTADISAPVRHAFQTVAERRREVHESNEALETRMRDVSPTAPKPKRDRASHVDPLSASVTNETTQETEPDPFL